MVGALLAGSALVYQASSSAYSSTTVNTGNSWAAGTVALTDDDSGTAMFSVTGLKPGSTGSKCIKVSSTSTLAGSVKLYGTSYSTTSSLATYLDITIDQGTVGTFSSCGSFSAASNAFTGTLASFGTTKTTFGTGVGSWTLTGTPTETQVYKITYTLNASAPDSTQGGTAAVGFTWEAQSS
ncbi:hypothetical protein E8D37_02545 [Nocardioides sp. GY 10127]|nr:hypothetical protein E8D37_02545 [Nocardioides sp. GY 10127]